MDKKFMKNKIGGERIYSLIWIVVWVVVILVIVIGVLKFYSLNFDVKELEADILSEKILNCVIDNGILIDELTNEEVNDFNIFDKCGMSEEIIKKDFYFKIKVITDSEKIVYGGNPGFEALCGQSGEHIPKCVTKKESIFYHSGNEIKKGEIEILAASNQRGEIK